MACTIGDSQSSQGIKDGAYDFIFKLFGNIVRLNVTCFYIVRCACGELFGKSKEVVLALERDTLTAVFVAADVSFDNCFFSKRVGDSFLYCAVQVLW